MRPSLSLHLHIETLPVAAWICLDSQERHVLLVGEDASKTKVSQQHCALEAWAAGGCFCKLLPNVRRSFLQEYNWTELESLKDLKAFVSGQYWRYHCFADSAGHRPAWWWKWWWLRISGGQIVQSCTGVGAQAAKVVWQPGCIWMCRLGCGSSARDLANPCELRRGGAEELHCLPQAKWLSDWK